MNFHRFLKTFGGLTLALLAGLSSSVWLPQAQAQVNVLTNKNDNARDGQNTSEILLSRSNVNSNQFGKLFAFNVDGYNLAQPLYMSALTVNGAAHNVVFASTMHDSVFAIDADTGTQLWQASLLYPSGATTIPVATQGCAGVTGFNEIGILGTPVIDSTTNTMYVVAKTELSGAYYFYLHALDVTTGLEKFGGPSPITATIGTLAFNVLDQIQRPALLLSNGTVYIGFGSNGCDLTARGWLFAYNAATLLQSAVMTTQPDNSYGSSIWQGGTGPAADSAGNVFLSTANGLFNYTANDLGDSVLKLDLGSGGFTVADYFTPFDQATMAANDEDLGSAGPTLLPPQTGSNTPDLLVTSGKDEDIYLINRDSMGGYNPTDNSQIVQYVPAALLGEFRGSPLYWNGYVYFMAQQDYLRSYSLSIDGNGNSVISTTPTAKTTGRLTTYGLPSISANGTTNGIVWLVRSVSGVPKLSAYDALTLFLIYDSGQAAGGRDTLGTVAHFATPTIANGKVYAGTQTQLVAYGLFSDLAPIGGSGQTGNAGSTLPTALTVFANNPYTGNGIAGVNVTLSDGGAGGVFGSTSITTGSNGQASTSYTLPKTPKNITITATSTGYASAAFTETSVVGPVAVITTVSGARQTGTVGTTLPNPIVVKAKDAAGNVVPNASISFTSNFGGTFSPNPGITGSTGQASVMFTLPTVAKPTITVTASNGSAKVNLNESSTAGSPALCNIIQGNNQMAHKNNKLPKTLILSITDQYGNGISGQTVNFSDNGAGGSFSNPAPITSTTGQVTVTYTTGPNLGTVTITAACDSLTPCTFTETVD